MGAHRFHVLFMLQKEVLLSAHRILNCNLALVLLLSVRVLIVISKWKVTLREFETLLEDFDFFFRMKGLVGILP